MKDPFIYNCMLGIVFALAMFIGFILGTSLVK